MVDRLNSTAEEGRDPAVGAMLGTFVGDALGMPYEGSPSAVIPAHLEMVEARLGRGTYTDDTQMAIALAESILEQGTVDREHLARAFLASCDPARGYGSGTLRLLELWRRGAGIGEAAAMLFGGEGSLGNGAAMRIAPVAIRYAEDPDALRAQAAASARLTHCHPLGTDAAVVQAAAVGAAIRGDKILCAAYAAAETMVMRRQLTLVGELLDTAPSPADMASALGTSTAGHDSVPTAIFAAISQPTFEAAVTFAVRCGGDTDTIGAMAGAIAGGAHGASAIPERWLDALEDGPRGRRHVAYLGAALARCAGPGDEARAG